MLSSQLKKDYLAGVGDSLDLVVVGGYYGKGKRTNVYGAFLLACYDADSEEYQTICKIGTGFSEEVLQSHYETLKSLELEGARGDIKVGGAKPDVWFEPKVVWEVLTADLSLSPIYTAAQGLVSMQRDPCQAFVNNVASRLIAEVSLFVSQGSYACVMTKGRTMLLAPSKFVAVKRLNHVRPADPCYTDRRNV